MQPLAPGEVIVAAEKKEGIERFLKGALARAPAVSVTGEVKANEGVGKEKEMMGVNTKEMVNGNTKEVMYGNTKEVMKNEVTGNNEPPSTSEIPANKASTNTPFTVPHGFQSFHVAPIHGLFETPKSYHFSQAPEIEEVETADDDRFAFSLMEETSLQEAAVAQVAAAEKEAKEREEKRRREEEERKEREKKAAEEREAREREARKKREEQRKKEEAAHEARRKREEALEREAAKRREEERHREAVKRQCQELQSAATSLLERMTAWQRRVETSLTRQTERVAALHERVDAETACWNVLVAMETRSHA